MPLQIKTFVSLACTTALGLSVLSLANVDRLLAQDSSINTIADESVANILRDNNCAILTNEGYIVRVEGARDDTDGDGRVERFCTPARVDRVITNEYNAEVTPLTQRHYDGATRNNKLLAIDIHTPLPFRRVRPGDYAIVISKTGVVNGTNVIDVVKVPEDDARKLLAEIERPRTVTVQRQEVAPTPAPAPTPPPAPAPAPEPIPQAEPAPPPRPVPALW